MIRALLIGSLERDSAVVADGSVNVACAADVPEAIRMLETGAAPSPELVVVAESRGGEFSATSLDLVRKQVPLARVWRMLGTWCEGESRSGRPPAACLATYWHQWEARMARELERVRQGVNPSWTLPVTATPDERMLASEGTFDRKRSGTIAICAASAAAAEALEDLCRAGGFDTLVAADEGRFRLARRGAVLWDTTIGRMTDERRVAEMRSRAGGAPVLAIVGFPRAGDFELARRLGIAAVISKPFLAGDLMWHLDRTIPPAG